ARLRGARPDPGPLCGGPAFRRRNRPEDGVSSPGGGRRDPADRDQRVQEATGASRHQGHRQGVRHGTPQPDRTALLMVKKRKKTGRPTKLRVVAQGKASASLPSDASRAPTDPEATPVTPPRMVA